MRYAIISDIHGNLHALQAVLKDIRESNIDKYIFVGDYFGDLPYPNEVTDIIKVLNKKYIVSGNKEGYLTNLQENNKDEWIHNQFKVLYWNYKELRKDNLDYLLQLPEKKIVCQDNTKKILILHSITSLFKETKLDLLTSSKYAERMDKFNFEHEDYLKYVKNIILTDKKLMKKLESIDADIIVFGHTHIQWYININGKILINAGSCGLPLDLKTTAPYTILDISSNRIIIEEHRVKYDIQNLIEEFKKSMLYEYAKGWSNIVIEELRNGRDEITFFFRYVIEVAKNHGSHSWPIENEIWNKAINSWFERNNSKDKYLL
ncbi:metallophosphoesterase family protein [Vallitalea guaymasensis]|uniref:Metallophosphoesterase family protein n=1 Tax=Vallitalea guaymasensis TaxID=1185412 RepID=A0A8J8M8Z2_9FIRM|nr:metallophosphoesterase [Vallitalea guaymasensis]QUH28499.1 metallophosphoesterase family protein [Vallitalea guaymasensis]